MGTVYQAVHKQLHRWVTQKVLADLWQINPAGVAHFSREMGAAGKLDHPNIVRATDAGQIGGVLFLVMDLAGRGTR